MGKRKYEGHTADSTKKQKASTIQLEDVKDEAKKIEGGISEDETLMRSSSKQLSFDIKHFRKELASKQGQTMVLTQFLQVCLNPDSDIDYLQEYLRVGGNSHEILRQISQDNKKNLPLTTPAFHIFHLIIIKVQSSMPHLISVTEEACRYFLNTFMSTVEIMISENSGPRHRKIILKLLTSMVTLNPDLGIEVLNQAPLTPKHLQYIVEKTNYKEKDNVRTTFVHFMTSFLVDGHLPLIKALLEKQGLLALVIPGLVQDEAEAVLMFLNILKKNIIDNNFINKSLKLKAFSHQVLHNIFKLFSWRGPPELSHEAKVEVRPEIMQLVSDIVITLFTSNKLGLYFVDTSLGTTDANKNQNLYKALLTLKRPWENEFECAVILQIIYKCPDLHRAIVSVIEQSFEPQHSPIWERATAFLIKLLDILKPEEIVPRMSKLNSIQIANFVRFMTLPVPLLKFMQSSIGKDSSISLYSVKVLVKMLSTLRRYVQILEMNDSNIDVGDLKNKLEYFVPKHLPAPSIIVALIQDIIDGKKEPTAGQDYSLPKINDTDALTSLVDLLLLYNDIHPTFFESLEGTLDMKKLLDYSATLSEGHLPLLKFKIVSLWLTLDSTVISLNNPMFKDLFLILLEVYSNQDGDTWIEAKDTLHKFFKNTSIFESDEDEIHLMLYTLRNSKITSTSLLGCIVEYVLEHRKDLTEYVRNQIVNFEISDENSQASLDKLLDDLTENRNTQESDFLENKVPSSFIVGCMQYLHNKKEAKKSMSQFLSLYVANLLHSNYSPELTEIFIGDSKLDIRSYVGGWTAQPMALPEHVSNKDKTLINIGKSIIENDNSLLLCDIFNCIEESSEDDRDLVLNDISYKVKVVKNMDSSELLIWVKYLIFCTVRLTNMTQLTDDQIKKISDYFECIIAVCKKHHMIDVCRATLIALFKNPHYLKVYRPLDVKKDVYSLLATKFLFKVVTEHKDMVEYLNKKQGVLKSFQQKNYNEIVKAFVKINKKKNMNTDHTVAVLELIGLSKEDDMRVFNLIFGAELDTCVKDDKEPSMVLDLLSILLNKYSKSISLELSHGVIKKAVKLYTDLLTTKEVVPNLANLENSLVTYFENKPHHSVVVTEDLFKKFFEANSIRKSTSQFAAVLLRLNVKFINIFKDQVAKQEILSQRELTLPLGSALLYHNQFLTENKDLLNIVYNEYKGNILKFLEKPHKAGQIYITCWKFVQKLITECMETQECAKFFNKTHKFETVETSHVSVLQSVFLKLVIDGGVKKIHFTNYFTTLLNMANSALKENKQMQDLVRNIYVVSEICKDSCNVDQIDFSKLIESGAWQNFCKAVLKDSLRVKTADHANTFGPQLLFLLRSLVILFYPANNDDIVSLFEMVTSHSEFLNVMLSYHSSDIKSRLVEFLFVLISKNHSVMKAQQVPVYLSAYRATRSSCDRLILSILHYYEANGLPVNEYKPYVFGDSAANYYAVRKNRSSSLWAHPTPNQVLNLFEKDIIERTVTHFPIFQKLDFNYELPPNIDINNSGVVLDVSATANLNKMINEGLFKPYRAKDNETAVTRRLCKLKYKNTLERLRVLDLVNMREVEEEGIYDPAFVLPLLSHLLSPGSSASCFRVVRAGLLALPAAGLAARCPHLRAACYHVLHRFALLLDTETKHKNDKLFLTDFINTLRQSLTSAIQNEGNIEEFKNPRLPAVDALYLAKALMVTTAPMDPLYKPVNNFFIAKQYVDLTVVPDFLSLFHDADIETTERRVWILDTIRDGTKSIADVNVVFKTMCLKMIMDFSSSVLCDRRVKTKILGAVTSVVSVPRALEILVEGYGLTSWLHCLVREIGKEDRIVVKAVLNLISTMINSMTVNAFVRNVNICAKNGKTDVAEIKVNKDVEYELFSILIDLLPVVEHLNEDLALYVRSYNLLNKRTLKLFNKQQMLRFISKCNGGNQDSEVVRLLNKAVVKNDASVLKSKNLILEDVLLSELSRMVRNYLE